VPFLSRDREALVGQAVVLEALQALYNICKFNKRVHLEVAATAGIVPHLCRFVTVAATRYHSRRRWDLHACNLQAGNCFPATLLATVDCLAA
jgi:hypothetical protein